MIGGIHPMMMTPVGGGGLKPQDVFKAMAYTGNSPSTRTITTGVDLASNGGLIWTKSRSDAIDHLLIDTARGALQGLTSNGTAASANFNGTVTSFGTTGYSLGNSSYVNGADPTTYTSWSFRRAAKFFDVVTYTGNGVAGRQIAHALGVAPGMMIVKRTDSSGQWAVYHRGAPNQYLILQTTGAAFADNGAFWGNGVAHTAPSPASFTVSSSSIVNASGATYVAYLFAHDTDASGIVQCGSFANGATVNLGWRPQFLLLKNGSNSGGWNMLDAARGFSGSAGVNDAYLQANASAAEASFDFAYTTSTGFVPAFSTADTQVYLAIREPIF